MSGARLDALSTKMSPTSPSGVLTRRMRRQAEEMGEVEVVGRRSTEKQEGGERDVAATPSLSICVEEEEPMETDKVGSLHE